MGSVNADRRKAAVREREAKVLELRKAGLTFDAIAKQVGYTSSGTAYTAFQRALQATIQQPADELRRLEVERMDVMLRALWPAVLKGRGYAVEKSLMIMDRRARLLGLDAPQRTQVQVSDALTSEIEALAKELGVDVDGPIPVNP